MKLSLPILVALLPMVSSAADQADEQSGQSAAAPATSPDSASAQDSSRASPSHSEPPGHPNSRARNSEPTLEPPPADIPPRDAWFPLALRPLQPYLQMAGRFSTNAIKPGALIESDPISDLAQAVKNELAKISLRYSLEQTLVMSTESNRVKGDPVIGAYAYSFFGNWTFFEGDEFGGTAGWLTGKVEGAVGLGTDLEDHSIRSDIGAVASPNNNYHSLDVDVQQLAWAQSFADGRFVAISGVINQTNYLDINRYANSSHGQFNNSALVNSMVIPAPSNNLGVQFQWQPCDKFYAMFATAANNQPAGTSPFSDLSWDNVSYLGEFGFILPDVYGFGEGTYRVQPFVATWEGDTGGGIAFNFEQQLGRNSPFGAFCRIGFGDEVTARVPGSVQRQVSAGLAIMPPLKEHGYFSIANNNFAGIGFVWSQPGDSANPDHDDEYALELTGALQITPTATIQPDLQFIWDPAFNPDAGPSVVFQVQLNLAW